MTICTKDSFPKGRTAGTCSLPAVLLPSLLLYIFLAQCLIKHMSSFTSYYSHYRHAVTTTHLWSGWEALPSLKSQEYGDTGDTVHPVYWEQPWQVTASEMSRAAGCTGTVNVMFICKHQTHHIHFLEFSLGKPIKFLESVELPTWHVHTQLIITPSNLLPQFLSKKHADLVRLKWRTDLATSYSGNKIFQKEIIQK